ncbi:uncharacterized protein LOC142403207 isoform X4 [Mycteria americana]|uniref:uncharacterized protein LOC142403207 isoform X4 n=1 Tax=Mycteria americana TaxID=33587 RepID=UPI003F58ACA0
MGTPAPRGAVRTPGCPPAPRGAPRTSGSPPRTPGSTRDTWVSAPHAWDPRGMGTPAPPGSPPHVWAHSGRLGPRDRGTPARLGPLRDRGCLEGGSSPPGRLGVSPGPGRGGGGGRGRGREAGGPTRGRRDAGGRAMGRSPWVWGRRRAPPAPPPAASPGVPGGGGRPPLPALGATLGRLLGALEALVAPGERDRARRLVREFGAPGGAGPRLQERLRRQPPAPPRLPEWPWGSSERLPLPVHTSAGLVLPRQDWEDWRGQLWFAARLIAGVLDYRLQLERRDPPEPWVQAAFGGCRVPGPQRDEVLRLPPGAQPPPFITVVRNCQFFQVEACGGEGTPLPAAALGAALGGLRARAGRGGAPPLGLLTGQHRHAWGRVYRLLMRDRLNRASIGRIQRSLFALSLDAPVLAAAGGRGPGGGAGQVLHGGGACANSGNRWFDKTLQFIVGEDGTCGVVYDPAVIDGAVVAEMVDHALDYCGSASAWAPKPPPRWSGRSGTWTAWRRTWTFTASPTRASGRAGGCGRRPSCRWPCRWPSTGAGRAGLGAAPAAAAAGGHRGGGAAPRNLHGPGLRPRHPLPPLHRPGALPRGVLAAAGAAGARRLWRGGGARDPSGPPGPQGPPRSPRGAARGRHRLHLLPPDRGRPPGGRAAGGPRQPQGAAAPPRPPWERRDPQ